MHANILVVGATGTLGRRVVERLKETNVSVRAATRTPETLRGAVDAVAFDFDRPELFADALRGISRVFLIARPGDEHADRTSIPFLEAARDAGVERVVNVSAMGAEREDHVPALRAIERHIEASGMAFTHLRPGFFFQLFTSGPLLAGIRATRVIALPAADARISFLDGRDVADVAVEALTRDAWLGRALTLTGSRAIDHHEVANVIASATGVDIRYAPLGEDTTREVMSRAGMPNDRIERLLRFYRLVRRGDAGEVTSDVGDVLGRAPRSFESFAREHADVWRQA